MHYIFSFFRYLYYAMDLALITLSLFLLSFLPSSFTRPFFPRLYQLWSLFFLRFFGIREHIHEKFTDPLPKQYILISNHP